MDDPFVKFIQSQADALRHADHGAKMQALGKRQMTLGTFIAELSGMPTHSAMRPDDERSGFFDFGTLEPTEFDSYRGFYSDLALGFEVEGEGVTVAGLLASAREALGKTYCGYKGGDYVMTDRTPLWAANYGRSGQTAICGLRDEDWAVFIETCRHD